MSNTECRLQLTQSEMLKILPHAYPFLMIDEVIDLQIGQSLVAIKNITVNEWIFHNQPFQLDHLPEPFLIEAAAQAALVLYALSDGMRGNGIKFIGKVSAQLHEVPKVGDQITISVRQVKLMKNLGFFNSSIKSATQAVMDLDLICGVMPHAK